MRSLLILIFLPICLSASGKEKISSEREKTETVYFELGGNGLFYSLNYDKIFLHRKSFLLSYRIGLHYSNNFIDSDMIFYGIPLETSALIPFYKKRHHFEAGIGLSPFYMIDKNTDSSYTNYDTDEDKEFELLSMYRFGYRLQSPKGGFFFKAGVTPLYYMKKFKLHKGIVWGGISFGYTFR